MSKQVKIYTYQQVLIFYPVSSIIGGVIVIAGLYMLLWGKEHDESQMKLEKPEDIKAPIFATEENNLKGEPYMF